MKPIPTTLRGVTFRSRLEARVSLFLDEWNIEWSYEHEGYELSDGTRYLPDFWLPEISTYLEVKGAHGERLDKVRRFAHDLYGADGADAAFGPDASNAWMYPKYLVLVAQFSRFLNERDCLSVINALGASVILIGCPACGREQWVNIGAFQCRSCRHDLTWKAHYSDPRRPVPPLPRLPQWMPAR